MGVTAKLTAARDVVTIDALAKKVSNVDANSTLLL
jgi:hypothetical protein